MKYIHNKEIDRDKWDDLVANSSEPRIYMLSWYLDITCPNWKAIVWKDYKIVLPLFVRSFYFLPYVPPPLLSQQTGIIFYSGVSYQRELNEFFKSIILKLFVRFSISFHSGVNIKVFCI